MSSNLRVGKPVVMPQASLTHARPWLMPAGVVAAIVGVVASAVLTSQRLPFVRELLRRVLTNQHGMKVTGLSLLAAIVVLGLFEQHRRWTLSKPPLPLVLRINRALAYGLGATLATMSLVIAHEPAYWGSFLFSTRMQAGIGVCAVTASAVLYVVLLHPFRSTRTGSLSSFQTQVGKQSETHDYTLGLRDSSDWEFGDGGAKEWATWPESGTYGNLLCVGQIGSGKTSQVADPLVLQTLAKFPGRPERQPSLLVLDLKGNQAARYWKWAKELGRGDDFWILRPDVLLDAAGEPVIPVERYVCFNALSGWSDTDLLAIEFQEALESTKDTPSPDYFRLVAQEFLIHALRLLEHETGAIPDLADLHSFAASAQLRGAMVKRSAAGADHERVQAAREYFAHEFGQLSGQDQASLLRGLTSQLTVLTSEPMLEAFCPGRGSRRRRELQDWHREIIERPGVIVFSCPPAKFTDGLSRLLGILVLKNFQQSMLARCDASFSGNRTRPVVLAIDEAHAFLNKRFGDFLSVSREARVVALLLTQSLSQIPRHYRGILLSNTRTRMVLSVSGESAEELSRLLGDVIEVKEQVSCSESLQGAQESALREQTRGRSKGLAVGKSFVEKERRRWSSHAIGHLNQFRAVAHIFEGDAQRESEVLETVPWYRLPYYILDPLAHADVSCEAGGQHTYARREKTLRCTKCEHAIDGWAAEDYRAMKRALVGYVARARRRK